VTKFCNKCQALKSIAEFGKDKNRHDGLHYMCLACRKLSRIANAETIQQQKRDHYARNRELLLERKRLSYPQHAAVKIAYGIKRYQANREEILERHKIYMRGRPDYYKQMRLKQPEKVNAKENKRKAAKLQRIPCWLTPDDFWMIEQAYDICALRTKMTGIEWHVDHIIPLQGKLVSGLHTPYNLQVIPASINTSKGNKFEV
jgi:head-tail adaptor